MSNRGFFAASVVVAGFVAGCSEDASRGGGAPATSASQGRPAQHESADAVVQRYFAAFHDCDWNAVAGLIHPQALVDFAHVVRPAIHQSHSTKTLADLGIQSVDEIDALSPTELFQRLLELKMKLRPALEEVYRSSSCAILGDVVEGELIHVVTRITATSSKGVKSSSVETISLQRSGSEWRLRLSKDLESQLKSGVSEAEAGR